MLVYVLTDNFYFAVRSLSKIVDDKMCIVSMQVIKEHLDLEADRALQVTLAVGGAN